MIFITVGTHEQGLDRLLKEMDRLIEQGLITDEVFAQIGYCEYKPRYFKYKELISYEEMDECIKLATNVITHGGPGSIFHALRYNKVPIVIPRNPEYNEHVDDHQILFTKRLEENSKVIAVYEICDLYSTLKDYSSITSKYTSYSCETSEFVKKFESLLEEKLNLR